VNCRGDFFKLVSNHGADNPDAAVLRELISVHYLDALVDRARTVRYADACGMKFQHFISSCSGFLSCF
jgi:hypothetical protein